MDYNYKTILSLDPNDLPRSEIFAHFFLAMHKNQNGRIILSHNIRNMKNIYELMEFIANARDGNWFEISITYDVTISYRIEGLNGKLYLKEIL